MDDSSRVLTAACVGAVVGGVVGWLYLTGSGRRIRDQVEPGLDRVMNDVKRARAAGEKAKGALSDGRELLADIMAVRQSA
jgi:uncharacterized protein YcfJ